MAEPRLEVDGNHDRCPICKGDTKGCKHSLSAMAARVWETWVRGIVRDEMRRERARQEARQ